MIPTRDTVAGRAYLDLRAKASAEGRRTDELQALYVLEGFLARLAASVHADTLVLKGGVLLAALAARRPTRDIDFLARELSNDRDTILAVVRDVAAVELSDGLVFDHAAATALVIRDSDDYPGVRVQLTCALASARIAHHVDVSVGDPVIPAPEEIGIPRLLGGEDIRLRGYPIVMVLAEKIITAVSRGTVNTRWRDFGDVYALCRQHAIDGDELTRALVGVAGHRHVSLEPLDVVLVGYGVAAQSKYSLWRRRSGRDELPADFDALLAVVMAFADPALSRQVDGLVWTPRAAGGPAWL